MTYGFTLLAMRKIVGGSWLAEMIGLPAPECLDEALTIAHDWAIRTDLRMCVRLCRRPDCPAHRHWHVDLART